MSRLPEFPIEGGCACGQLRYRLTAPPIAVFACHCADCQTLTGSAFSLAMPVLRQDFEIVRGELATWMRTAQSGTRIPQRYCASCGTRVLTEPPGGPHSLTLRPGTLDDTGWFAPVAAFWVASAQPWLVFPPGLLAYETQPTDFRPVMAAWRAWVEG